MTPTLPTRTTLLLSLPVGAVQQLSRWAERNGQSVSQYCAEVLGNHLADKRGQRRMDESHYTARNPEEMER